MMLQYLAAAVVTLSIAFLTFGIMQAMRPSKELDERIDEWLLEYRSSAGKRASRRGNVLDRVDRVVARRGFGESIKADLARAGLPLTVTEYMLIHAGFTIVPFVVGILLRRDLLTGLLLGALGFIIPIVYVRMRERRRLRAFNSQLPDVLDHLVGSLRAGYGLVQALEWVGKQISDPAGMEFERVIREIQLGRTLQDSLDSMLKRIDSDDLALIITAINIQYKVGGALADILETVADTIRERVRIMGEIQVLTAQQRYSGYVLMVLPIALGIFLYILNPEYESQLFTPGPTLCIPIGAAIMMIVGFFIMRRIVDIEV